MKRIVAGFVAGDMRNYRAVARKTRNMIPDRAMGRK